MAAPTSLEQRAQIKRLAAQGFTSSAIAEKLGLSIHVVRKWRKKSNLFFVRSPSQRATK